MQAAQPVVNKTLPNIEVFHLDAFVTTYYSLIQVFHAIYNFQTKAPYLGMLAELFLTTEMWPQLGWSKATLLQPTRVQTRALNHRGGGTVPARSRRKHGEETCCHFTPSPQHSTGVNTLNLVANALQSLWYFRGWDCVIAGEDAVCSILCGMQP